MVFQSAIPRLGGLLERIGGVRLLGDVEVYGVPVRNARLVFGEETSLQ